MYVCKSKNEKLMLIDGLLALRSDKYQYPPCMPAIKLFYDEWLNTYPELSFDGISAEFDGYGFSYVYAADFVSYRITGSFSQFSISERLLYNNNKAKLSIFGTIKNWPEINFNQNPIAFVKKETNGDVYIKTNRMEEFVFIGNFPVFDYL